MLRNSRRECKAWGDKHSAAAACWKGSAVCGVGDIMAWLQQRAAPRPAPWSSCFSRQELVGRSICVGTARWHACTHASQERRHEPCEGGGGCRSRFCRPHKSRTRERCSEVCEAVQVLRLALVHGSRVQTGQGGQGGGWGDGNRGQRLVSPQRRLMNDAVPVRSRDVADSVHADPHGKQHHCCRGYKCAAAE